MECTTKELIGTERVTKHSESEVRSDDIPVQSNVIGLECIDATHNKYNILQNEEEVQIILENSEGEERQTLTDKNCEVISNDAILSRLKSNVGIIELNPEPSCNSVQYPSSITETLSSEKSNGCGKNNLEDNAHIDTYVTDMDCTWCTELENNIIHLVTSMHKPNDGVQLPETSHYNFSINLPGWPPLSTSPTPLSIPSQNPTTTTSKSLITSPPPQHHRNIETRSLSAKRRKNSTSQQ